MEFSSDLRVKKSPLLTDSLLKGKNVAFIFVKFCTRKRREFEVAGQIKIFKTKRINNIIAERKFYLNSKSLRKKICGFGLEYRGV